MRPLAIVCGLSLGLLACSYDRQGLEGTGFDAGGGGDTDSGVSCDDVMCDDGVWCNGDERCDPSDPAADEMGCAPGPARCVLTGECLEADRSCGSGCDDDDGDGHEATFCGGDDCDDTDARRNPGGTERCDAEGLDEDCNPATFGELDADADGFFDASCCNGTFCGDDCDDTRADINPSIEVEVCDEVDTDCDGLIDEGVQTTYYRDSDGDGHGVAAPTTLACSRPSGYANAPDDCNDSNSGIYPGRAETCDTVDQDCDGRVDEGLMCP